MRSDSQPFTLLAIVLHWLAALLILGNLAFGLYFVDLPLSPQKLRYFSWHKWAGAVVLPIAGGLLAWRAVHRCPVSTMRSAGSAPVT